MRKLHLKLREFFDTRLLEHFCLKEMSGSDTILLIYIYVCVCVCVCVCLCVITCPLIDSSSQIQAQKVISWNLLILSCDVWHTNHAVLQFSCTCQGRDILVHVMGECGKVEVEFYSFLAIRLDGCTSANGPPTFRATH